MRVVQYFRKVDMLHSADKIDAEFAVLSLLEYIGEDTSREGLQDTPKRVVRAYDELFSGYKYDDAAIDKMMTVFSDGACDEMVMLRDIEFVSFCEHHMLPFTGKAHVAYIPNGQVVGISKLARLVDVYARRLQIQEKLTQQVTHQLERVLSPRGSACMIESRHACMTCRGVLKQNSVMVTSSLTGAFRNDQSCRQEFYALINAGRSL